MLNMGMVSDASRRDFSYNQGAPLVSIVIVNWNTREVLRQCVGPIFECTSPLAFEVIVVDNASADGSV